MLLINKNMDFMLCFILIAIAFIFLICGGAIAQEVCTPERDKHGNIERSSSVVRRFKFSNPCPGTGIIQNSCPGYVVDHIIPLCNCGADAVENMQWQTVGDAKIKDRWERDVCAKNAQKIVGEDLRK